MIKRNAWLIGTAAITFALTGTWANPSEAQGNRNGVRATDPARRAVQIRNNVRRSQNLQDAQRVYRDAQALAGRELTATQRQQLLAAVTARNLAIEVAQEQFSRRAQTLAGANTDSSQLSNAQRQQLRELTATRDAAIRAARETLKQNVATTLGMTVEQLGTRSDELKIEAQLQQLNNGRPLTEAQWTTVRAALTTRNAAVQAAQDQYRQSARELLPNANGAQLTEAQQAQLRPLAATRDAAIRAAQDAFRQSVTQSLGVSADALNTRDGDGNGEPNDQNENKATEAEEGQTQ